MFFKRWAEQFSDDLAIRAYLHYYFIDYHGKDDPEIAVLTIDDLRESPVVVCDPAPIPLDEMQRTFDWLKSWGMLEATATPFDLVNLAVRTQAHHATSTRARSPDELPHHFRRLDQEAILRSLTSGADLAARSVDDGTRSRRLASYNSLRVRSRRSRRPLMRRTATAIRPPTIKGATRITT